MQTLSIMVLGKYINTSSHRQVHLLLMRAIPTVQNAAKKGYAMLCHKRIHTSGFEHDTTHVQKIPSRHYGLLSSTRPSLHRLRVKDLL